jgi:predicted secreted protein
MQIKPQPAPAILGQELVYTTLSITHQSQERPSTDPRTLRSSAVAEERRPEPSTTNDTVEPVVAHAEEEAPAEAMLVDIASILGAPTVTVVWSSL